MKNILQTFLAMLFLITTITIFGQTPAITAVTTSNLTATSVRLNITMNPNSASSSALSVFRGTNASNLVFSGGDNTQTGTTSRTIIVNQTGLTPNTQYFYRLSLDNPTANEVFFPSATTTNSFTTAAATPTISNQTITYVSNSSAIINFQVLPNATGTTTTRILYDVTGMGNLTLSTTGTSVTSNVLTNRSITLTGLPAATQVIYAIEAVNTAGTTLTNQSQFDVIGVPVIASIIATPTATTAGIAFTVNSSWGATSNISVEYGTSPTLVGSSMSPALSNIPFRRNVADAKSDTLTGLTPSTTYYYRILVTNATGPTQSAILSFTTPPAPPPAPSAQTICSPATVGSLLATGTALKWYADPTGGTALANSTTIITGDYYVSQTVNTVESARTLVNVTVSTTVTPVAPTAPTTYTFCNVLPADRFLSLVGATGTNLKWYDSPTSSTVQIVFAATSTTTYYVSQTTGSCESPRRAVSISAVTAAAIPINSSVKREAYELNAGNQPVLSSGPKTLADYSFIDSGGNTVSSTNLVWYSTASAPVPLANTMSVVFTLGNPSNPDSAQDLIYHVAVRYGTCEGARQLIRIIPFYRPIPNLGTITSCSPYPRSGFIWNAIPRSYNFYTTATGGTPIAENSTVPFGTYYVSDALDSVEGNRGQFVFSASNLSTTWSGTAWSAGVPSATTAAIFNGSYSQTGGTFNACSVTVNGTAVVNFVSASAGANGAIVTVNNGITVASTASFNLGDKCVLLQYNDVQNTGNIRQTIKTNLKRLDYTYWSSPVAGQNLLAFSQNTLPNRFYGFSETTNAFVGAMPASNNFVIGNGYSIRAPNNFTSTAQNFDGVFTGVPNNGPIDIAITTTALPTGANGFNLIGNPYPGVVFIPNFISANAGTLYFWTKIATGSGIGNYASRNATGGTAATLGGLAPSEYLSPGQGFIFKASLPTTTNVKFNSSIRTIISNVTFFRTANNTTNSSNPSKLWLNLTGDQDLFSQTLVAYNANTTNGFDSGYDGHQINTSNSLSTILENENYSIQSRAAFTNTDIVPMSINIETAGNYAISIDHTEGIFDNQQNVFLKDNATGVTHNLSQAPYNFVATAGANNNRFELRYVQGTLGVSTNVFTEKNVIAFKDSETLKIKSSQNFDSVMVHDIRGVLLFESKNINSNTFETSKISSQCSVLLVKIKSGENVVTKKIIF